MASRRAIERHGNPRNKRSRTCPHCCATTYVTKGGKWYRHRHPSEGLSFNTPINARRTNLQIVWEDSQITRSNDMKTKQGNWRVDWITKSGACRGCKNQEWFMAKRDAEEREKQLKRGGFEVSVWKESR